MYTKSIFLSLVLLVSLNVQAFDKSTAYIDSAELIFSSGDKDSVTSGCGVRTHSQREAKVVIVSYDEKINKQTIEMPVVVRSSTQGLLCYMAPNNALSLLNLEGKNLGSILGIYQGGAVAAAFTTQLGYAVHVNKSGVVLSDFATLLGGLGLKIGNEKLIIDRISSTSNISIGVTDTASSKTQQTVVNMDNALQDINF